jgi:hypothetical protein
MVLCLATPITSSPLDSPMTPLGEALASSIFLPDHSSDVHDPARFTLLQPSLSSEAGIAMRAFR